MAGEKVVVHGIARMNKQLLELDDHLIVEMKAINKNAAETVAIEARGRVPRASGMLGDSIRAGSTARSGTVRAGNKSVLYAGPIHFGWPRHHITPQPFLWDALDAQRGAVLAEYEKNLKHLIDDAFPPGGD